MSSSFSFLITTGFNCYIYKSFFFMQTINLPKNIGYPFIACHYLKQQLIFIKYFIICFQITFISFQIIFISFTFHHIFFDLLLPSQIKRRIALYKNIALYLYHIPIKPNPHQFYVIMCSIKLCTEWLVAYQLIKNW